MESLAFSLLVSVISCKISMPIGVDFFISIFLFERVEELNVVLRKSVEKCKKILRSLC